MCNERSWVSYDSYGILKSWAAKVILVNSFVISNSSVACHGNNQDDVTAASLKPEDRELGYKGSLGT